MKNIQPISRHKPVAEQAEDLLRERILQGGYPPGERMPSEDRLAEQLGVSRATVRTALAALAAEGLVQRRQGDGTYATPHAIEINVRGSEAWNIVQQIQRSGRRAEVRVLAQGSRPATEAERQAFAMEAQGGVYAIRRLFLADDVPVMLAEHAVRAEGLAGQISPEAASLTMLEFLERYYKGVLTRGEAVFKAVAASPEVAEILRVEVGSPLMRLEARLWDSSDSPAFVGWELYRGEEGFHLPVAPLHS
jgi:GntR family transcriptional regulator